MDWFVLVFVYATFGLITATTVLWSDFSEDRVTYGEVFGVALLWPLFVIKGVYKAVIWAAEALIEVIIMGIDVLRR